MRLSRRWLAVLAAAVAAAALALGASGARAAMRHRAQPDESAKPFSLEPPEPQFPVGAQWSLTEFNGKSAGSDPPSLMLDDKLRASGFSGCNTYSMTLYPIRGQKLAAGGIAVTRKQCDQAVMLMERAFLVALHSLPTWSIEAGDLVIKAPRLLLRFRRGV